MINTLQFPDNSLKALYPIVECSNLLRNLRESAGLTVAELSAKSRISRSYIYKVEGDATSPSIDVVKRWVQATKPGELNKERLNQWLGTALRLIMDESSCQTIDNELEERLNQGVEPVKFLHRILPMKFLNHLMMKEEK